MKIEIVKVNGRVGCDIDDTRRYPHHPHGGLGSSLGRRLDHRMQVPREQEMRQIVGAQLQLIALGRTGAPRRDRDACIEPEHMQLRFRRNELVSRGFDGGEIVEVEVQKHGFALRRRVRGLDAVDGFLCAFFGARRQVNGGLVLV